MFLIVISLITGTLGLLLGSVLGLDVFLGVIGFLCPSVYLIEKMYVKIEDGEGGPEKAKVNKTNTKESEEKIVL